MEVRNIIDVLLFRRESEIFDKLIKITMTTLFTGGLVFFLSVVLSVFKLVNFEDYDAAGAATLQTAGISLIILGFFKSQKPLLITSMYVLLGYLNFIYIFIIFKTKLHYDWQFVVIFCGITNLIYLSVFLILRNKLKKINRW